MGLITDNKELKMYVPNVLAEAAGEPSFLDKLSEYLNAAERWAADMFTGDELLESIASGDPDGLREVFLPVVVYESVGNALPSFDLVLTPNGFGSCLTRISLLHRKSVSKGLQNQRSSTATSPFANCSLNCGI